LVYCMSLSPLRSLMKLARPASLCAQSSTTLATPLLRPSQSLPCQEPAMPSGPSPSSSATVAGHPTSLPRWVVVGKASQAPALLLLSC
jgi:hypothetical protein